MLRRHVVLSFITALLAASIAMAKAAAPLDELVRAERQFSATSVDKGMRDAFVEFLADEAVLFRPLPVDGKKLWTSRTSVPGTLIWEPSFAQVAASGDFGYTTGPWEFRPPASDSTGTVAHGHFISIWRRNGPDAPWRVAVDIGIQHDKPERGLGSGLRDSAAMPAQKARKDDRADVAALDRQLSERTFVKGVGSAIADVAASDFILNRDGFQPALGIAPARAAFDSLKGGLRFDSRGGGIASSQDLGFTYGVTHWFVGGAEAPSDSGVYMHVWRREAGKKWKLALAVENPL
jgi:ketosteroid isomerase-like protein